ncbi:DNA repair protein RecN [Flavobacteriaceae sp. LMIT009]
MLTSLSIKNYALIDDLHVNFNNGLTIITGETGAGKSILLGGLSLILGKRADSSTVKDSSKKVIIEAVFDIANYNLKTFFKEEDLDFEAETILRREILPSGKSRAFVNDSPVNLDILSKLGAYLIDIHSQHQTLELTSDSFQFQIIDALADNSSLLASYRTLLSELKEVSKKLKELRIQKANAVKEYDYNLFLFNELNDANLVSGELTDLEIEHETLNNVEEIKEELIKAYQILNDEQVGMLSALSNLKQVLNRLSGISTNYSHLFDRLSSLSIELDDIYTEIENSQDKLEADPERLEEVNTKLSTIHNLLLKHTASNIEELIEIREELSKKVLATETIDDEILAKGALINELDNKLDAKAQELHNRRVKVIPSLTSQLEDILMNLGMENSKFNISLTQSDNFFINGKDELAFLFAANKGGEFKPLKKAASGGELSRIMLAVKSILSKYIQLPSIMFDEIDTGVSGEISNKMAEIMQQMSKSMQVFTITHLPQIAAKGDTHFKVFKRIKDDKTVTEMSKLNTDERIVEIAQMLGGKEMSSSAIEHAKQLLN